MQGLLFPVRLRLEKVGHALHCIGIEGHGTMLSALHRDEIRQTSLGLQDIGKEYTLAIRHHRVAVSMYYKKHRAAFRYMIYRT